MPDYYRSDRGTYERYDYQRKGDVFTRRLSALPRVYTTVTHSGTGRRYLRRSRTDHAQAFTPTDLLGGKIEQEEKERLANTGIYLRWDRKSNTIMVRDEAPGWHLEFDLTQQHLGSRLWFYCLGCSRRIGKLYTVRVGPDLIWGCQKCLGLSYPSQYGHKTVWHDNLLLGQKGRGLLGTTPCEAPRVSLASRLRAHRRHRQRLGSFVRRVDAMTGRLSGVRSE